MAPLPIIDVSALSDPDPAAWSDTVAAIDHALRDNGFMYITGHGIEPAVQAGIFDRARQFFSQPTAEKQKISIKNWDWHRGWGEVGAEKLEESKPGDLKESFDMGMHLPTDHPDVQSGRAVYGPNQYPEIPGWREEMEAHYERMLALGLRLLRAVALALDAPVDYFDQRFSRTVSVLRVLHYLPATFKVAPDQLGAGAHTDYGCMTLLAQDGVGGLQVMAKDGSWIDAPPVEGAFVCNIGDMMNRWTAGEYKSTLHRVTGDLSTDRYSIPFFLEPDYDTLVETFPSCLPPDGANPYPPVVSGDWLMSRLNATFEHREDA